MAPPYRPHGEAGRSGTAALVCAQATENGWSRDVLAHHITTGLHQRTGTAVSNFAATLPPGDSDLAQQATRDPYLFDFLGHTQIHRERDLEHGQITHLEKFLLELGVAMPVARTTDAEEPVPCC